MAERTSRSRRGRSASQPDAPSQGGASSSTPAPVGSSTAPGNLTPPSAPSPMAGLPIGRTTVPSFLIDPDQREAVGVPREEDRPGPYMVELNLLYKGGLPG